MLNWARSRWVIVAVALAVVGGAAGFFDEGVGLGIFMAAIFAFGAALGGLVICQVARSRRKDSGKKTEP